MLSSLKHGDIYSLAHYIFSFQKQYMEHWVMAEDIAMLLFLVIGCGTVFLRLLLRTSLSVVLKVLIK